MAYLNLFTASPSVYTFGRQEGAPARGPNPVPGPGFGSRDVDTLYDMVPLIHQYYLDRFGRNGPNGLGGTGDGVIRAYNTYVLFANGKSALYDEHAAVSNPKRGDSGYKTGYAVPDVVGHEMFHFVEHHSGLFPNYPPTQPGQFTPAPYYTDPALAEFGSLIEAMSDFFGEGFERYISGTNDWLAGTGPTIAPVRSMMNPSSILDRQGRASADHVLSSNFYTPLGGDNFTYLNAGVVNKLSYLAVEGGYFNGLQIEGLGFDKVEQIWYRAVTEYFTPTETFAMAYDHFLLSANDLYGAGDAAKLELALRAVELNGVAVPESSTLALATVGMLGLVIARVQSRSKRERTAAVRPK